MNTQDIDLTEMVELILNSRKYRRSNLNQATIEDLIRQEAPQHTTQKALLKKVRRKLHNIVAPYLGEPDYASLSEQLSGITNPSLSSPELRKFCTEVLSEHASTAERIPRMSWFYGQLFQSSGKPNTILDLACGLHPLAFPWMGLPLSTRYHAYDIIQPRIDFINAFFQKIGLNPLAENRDILVNPPQIHADLGIFFKEAHRFEKRKPGCNFEFWQSLNVERLAVSLPAQDLSGTHSLLEQHRSLVLDNLPEGKLVTEIILDDEVVFLIKEPGTKPHG